MFTAVLQSTARQLDLELQVSPPQLVGGSLNPPPSPSLPGLVCYLVRVRAGSSEFSGYGATSRAARSAAELAALRGLQRCLRERRERRYAEHAPPSSANSANTPVRCPPPHPLLGTAQQLLTDNYTSSAIVFSSSETRSSSETNSALALWQKEMVDLCTDTEEEEVEEVEEVEEYFEQCEEEEEEEGERVSKDGSAAIPTEGPPFFTL